MKVKHMAFFFNVFYADYLAAAIRHELQRCMLRRMSDDHTHEMDVGYMNYETLPASPNFEKEDVCKANSHLLQMDSSSILTYNKPGIVEEVTMDPPDSWHLVDEGKGKTGWVHEFHPEDVASGLKTSSIFFKFSDPRRLMDTKHFLVNIEFFRTYKNAGKASIVLCGNPVFIDYDALFPHFQMSRFSVNEMRHWGYPIPFAPYCLNTDHVLEIQHTYVESGDHTEMIAREMQKFKLVSVEICDA